MQTPQKCLRVTSLSLIFLLFKLKHTVICRLGIIVRANHKLRITYNNRIIIIFRNITPQIEGIITVP